MQLFRRASAIFTAFLITLSSVACPLSVFAKSDNSRPVAPANVSIVRTFKRQARIKWDESEGAEGYYVYRSSKNGFEKIADVKKTRYIEKNIGRTKTYSYKICAYTVSNGQIKLGDYSQTVTLAKASVFSKKLVNQTKLRPMLTGHIDVDKKAEKILKKIINNKMSNYQKLKAIYKYCATAFSYSRNPNYYLTSSDYSAKLYKNSVAMDIYYLDRAMTAFKTKKGACTAYSGALAVLCDLAGFSAYIDEGDIHSSSGGYTGHTWAKVYFGGTYFIFDPQVEQSNLSSNKIPYTYFGQSPKSSRYKSNKTTLRRSVKLRNKAQKAFCGKSAKSVTK